MKIKPLKYILFFIVSLSTILFSNDNIIIMGYKDISKMPLIGEKNNNSGLYFDLFSKAAKRIGYKLEIKRYPKKRINIGLSNGTIDFYPGSSFSQKRTKYLYYLPNGLDTKEVLISLDRQPEIYDMNEAKGALIVERGSSKLEWSKIYTNLKIIELGELSIEKVIKALKIGRGDFYISDIEIVDYYKKINNLNNYSDINIRIHHMAINKKPIPMNLGFSRKSKLFSEKKNLNYNNQKIISLDNFPTIIDKNSIAYKFFIALDELKKEKITNDLYDRYIKDLK
jgi:hypothetical protein